MGSFSIIESFSTAASFKEIGSGSMTSSGEHIFNLGYQHDWEVILQGKQRCRVVGGNGSN